MYSVIDIKTIQFEYSEIHSQHQFSPEGLLKESGTFAKDSVSSVYGAFNTLCEILCFLAALAFFRIWS